MVGVNDRERMEIMLYLLMTKSRRGEDVRGTLNSPRA